MIKELIKQRFSRSLKTYHNHAVVQKQMAEKLTQKLSCTGYDNILEIGCGTGFVTEILNKKCQYRNYDAIDIVSDCELFIRKISDKINFINADIEELEIIKKYNLIISNASFQWVDDFEGLVKKLKSNLAENGILIFTTFGHDNFKELKKITGNSLKYYSTTELEQILKDYEIMGIEEEKIFLEFNNPKEVLNHIKNTGVNALNKEHWTKSDLQEFIDKYNNICPDKITLTYNPVYVEVKI